MLSSDIYNKYLSLAEKSDLLLRLFNDSTYTSVNRFYELELKSINRNIKFIYKKLISLLSNKQVWTNVSHTCNIYGYKVRQNSDTNLSAEFEFLIENRDEFLRQLDCIINTTSFEIDLKFLDVCVNKLEVLYNRFKNKGGEEYPAIPASYSLAC